MPKQILASHLGISGETLSRLLAKFEADGIIYSQWKSVQIRSIERLREIEDFGAT